jgi:hypothetical protein
VTDLAVLERPRAAVRGWGMGAYGPLLIGVALALVILFALGKRRRAHTDAHLTERSVPFALRDLDLTPEAAEDLTKRLENPSALPARPLRGVTVAGGPGPVA